MVFKELSFFNIFGLFTILIIPVMTALVVLGLEETGQQSYSVSEISEVEADAIARKNKLLALRKYRRNQFLKAQKH